jgi:cytochrome c-type biogenesis protein CcmH
MLLVVAVSLAVASSGGSPSAAERTQRLDAELRCPVCQGESVADSPSSTARAIAADVARRVAAGESDEEIRQAYVDRYGEGILLTPTGAPGVVAVALPLVVLAAAATGFVLTVRRGRRERAPAVAAGDAELVARLRRERIR